MPFLTQGKTNWKFLLIVIVLAAIVGGGIFAYQYFWLPKEEAKISTERYCEKDEDCACGVHKTTRDCFYGNKNYVDATQQCPDFCTGIAANFKIKCVSKECKQINVIEDETADWQIYTNEEYGFEIKYPHGYHIETEGALEDNGLVYRLFGIVIYKEPEIRLITLSVVGPDFRIGTRNWEPFSIGELNAAITYEEYGGRPFSEINFSSSKNYFFGEIDGDILNDRVISQTLSTFRFVEEKEGAVDWAEITTNSEFREYFEEIIKTNPGLEEIKKFSKSEATTIRAREVGYPSPPKSKDEPEWVFSPDGTKAVSIFAYFGEPDGSLDIYNRENDGKVERLQDCGTPCSYWIVFWLNNERFIFIQEVKNGLNAENRLADLIITVYDIAKNTEISYTSQEIKGYPIRPSWPEWDDKYYKPVCAKLYGEENCQVTPR